MKLSCKKCGAEIPIAEETIREARPRVECGGCGTRYRLRPRKTPPPTGVAPPPSRSLTPAAPSTVGAPPATGTPPATDQLPPIDEHPTDRLTTLAIGDLVAERYRIVRFVAHGGMGEVYEAEDLELRERVALKTIGAHLGLQEGMVERFKREIQLARKVTHPNVCRIFDLGVHRAEGGGASGGGGSDLVFLSMELLEGETLDRFCARLGRLSAEQALPLARQIAGALEAAHAAGVVHRDLKSENVFLVPGSEGLRAVVTDFGIARGAGGIDSFGAAVTGVGFVGTPAYVAPEQLEQREVTAAADIYSFGIVLYEMVTGRLPFEGDTPMLTAVQRLKEPPRPPHVYAPDLEPRWQKAILRCLEREPERRFTSAAEVVRALATEPPGPPAPGASVPAPAAPATPAEAPPPEPGTGPTAVYASVSSPAPARRRLVLELLLLVVLLAAAGLYFWNRQRAAARFVPRSSVAVLGLENLSGRPEAEWLSTALARMLTTELASGESLRTVPPETVARVESELGIEDVRELGEEELRRMRSALGSDFVVAGAYTALPGEAGERLRVDLRLHDAALGRTVETLAEEGEESELFALVERVGRALRRELGAAESSAAAASGLPETAAAARLYSEAVEKLRLSEPEAARDLLQEAIRTEPGRAFLHSALSQAWDALGYGERATAEAERAFRLSEDLGREDRILLEGLFLKSSRDWPRAIEIFRSLWEYFPDNLEYGLRLAAVEVSGGEPAAALETVEELGRLPEPSSEDPRIDLAEASAAAVLFDFERQERAARRAAERAEAAGAGLLHAEACLARSQALRVLGRPEEAERVAGRALETWERAGSRGNAALARLQVAAARVDRGELDPAAEIYEEVLRTYTEVGNQEGRALALSSLAQVLRKKGRLDRAQELYGEAAEIYRETGNRLGEASTSNNLATLFVGRGYLTMARKMFEEALEIWRQVGDRGSLAYAYNNLAAVTRLEGDLARSAALSRQATELHTALGQRAGAVTAQNNLAAALAERGELDEAEALLAAASAAAGEIASPHRRAQSLYQLAEARLWRGDPERSRSLHREALELRRQAGERPAEIASHLGLARLELAEGDPAAAVASAQLAAAASQRDSLPAEEARARALMTRALVELGDLEEAAEILEEAELAVDSSEELALGFELDLARAGLAAARGDASSARAGLEDLAASASAADHLLYRLQAELALVELLRRAGDPAAAEAADRLRREAELHGLDFFRARAAVLR